MYECNTQRPGYKGVQDTFLVQDGYVEHTNEAGITVSKEPRFVYMRNRNSRDCKYDRVNIDPKCASCTTENHLRDVTKKEQE